MAGIGFELKKLFDDKDGYIDTIKAYSVSAVVTEGPMILSIFMLFILRYLIKIFGGSYFERDFFIAAVSYTMIFSMMFSNTVDLFVSRYISDCIFEKRYEDIISAFYSTVVFMMLLGGTSVMIYLAYLNINYMYKIVIYINFIIVMITWIQLTFLSAIKKYTNILIGFVIAVLTAIIFSVIMMYLRTDALLSALCGNLLGYFCMMIIFMKEIKSYYPQGKINLFKIISAIDEYKILIFIGLFMTLGLYGHNMIMWFGEYSIKIVDNMRFCIIYDIPAFYASISIISMFVIFTVSLETSFYTQFREYFNCILCGGRYKDIKKAYKKMVYTLLSEILRMCQIQVLFTITACIFGADILGYIGLDQEMSNIFRMLCIGYFFYGIQRSIVIVLLYFDDRKGAFTSVFTFFIFSIICTFITRIYGIDYYGCGMFAAGVIGCITAFIRLNYYLKNLDYNIFCRQPLFINKSVGRFQKLSYKLEKYSEKIYKRG